MSSGQFDSSVKSTTEFTTFDETAQRTCSCQGGDPSLATLFVSSPESKDVYTTFQSWVATSRELPDVMSFQIMTLWDLMSAAISPDVYNRAPDIQAAFQWVTAHPALHQTKCRFVVSSDWGEVGLLTPSAFIIPDPESPPPTDNVVFSSTKISFGREHSFQYQRDVIIE